MDTQKTSPVEHPLVVPVVSPLPVLVPPKKNLKSLFWTLLFLVILLSATTAFFIYQNFQLRQQLTAQLSFTPPPSPAGTLVKEGDPTSDWKTYTNTSSSYSIRYPRDWNITNVSAGSGGTIIPDARYVQIWYKESTRDISYGILGFEEIQMIPSSEEKTLDTEKTVGGVISRCTGDYITETKSWCWVKVPDKAIYLNIQIFKGDDLATNETFDQILSTFKFIE